MTKKVINYNRNTGKYVEPEFTRDYVEKIANPSPSVNQNVARLMLKLEAMDLKLTRIETKLHLVSEGQVLRPGGSTIGDMVKKSLDH